MRSVLTLILFASLSLSVIAQDNIASGRALKFDGIDDLVNLGNIYDNLTLPLTMSAWLYFDADAGPAAIFVSQDNPATTVARGFDLNVSQMSVGIQYGDGTGGNSSFFRRGKAKYFPSTAGHWVHVTGVLVDVNDMRIYINGVNVGGDFVGESDLPMNSNFPQDLAKIGYRYANGNVYHFKGMIDEMRVWNRALTEAEIRETMCKKLSGNETGLVGYWNFNETSGNTVLDSSPNGFHGQLQNGVARVFSGAPIGDESVYLYPSSWTNTKATMTSGIHKVDVENVTSNLEGVHIYKVDNIPSQTGGLDISKIEKPYFGVFTARGEYSMTHRFDVNYEISGGPTCAVSSRKDNSVTSWTPQANLLGITERIEFISTRTAIPDFTVDLGADQNLCDQASTLLSINIDPAGKLIVWNTGETTPSIVVNQSGAYSVTVIMDCVVDQDSVAVLFQTSPPEFSLGNDTTVCSVGEIILRPIDNPVGLDFTWQDGSTDDSFIVTDHGTYWVNVENACGSERDSITFEKFTLPDYEFPNVITANGDTLNTTFKVHELLKGSQFVIYNRWGKQVYFTHSYNNEWDGDDLPSSTYYYKLSSACLGDFKGWIRVLK